jgi:hypothetical protein
MSTAEKKEPMTREQWDEAFAKIHADLDSIPEEVPSVSNWQIPTTIFTVMVTLTALGLVAISHANAGPIVYFVGGFFTAVSTWLITRATMFPRER